MTFFSATAWVPHVFRRGESAVGRRSAVPLSAGQETRLFLTGCPTACCGILFLCAADVHICPFYQPCIKNASFFHCLPTTYPKMASFRHFLLPLYYSGSEFDKLLPIITSVGVPHSLLWDSIPVCGRCPHPVSYTHLRAHET